MFPTADGRCAIGTPGDTAFATLCRLIGRPELSDDERFVGSIDRLVNRAALNVELTAWTTTMSTQSIVEALGGHVPVGPVNDMAAVANDPHVAAREMLVQVEQPDGSRPVTLAGQPIKMTKSETGIRARPPRLGEHTDEVLDAAGIRR